MATPQFGVWGIDLGQCALKAIRLENVDGEVTATAFDYIEHPKILSQPDADPDELTREALQQFLSRNSIKGDMLVISVPGQSGLARFVKLPPVEEKKIADIVKFEAKQQIPFPLEEVVWDFQKIGQGVVTDGFAMETEIGLFAMKKDMVHRALQQFKDVHVEVHVIQMAPLALCNYVAYDLLKKNGVGGGESDEAGDKKECVVALDIGTDNSNLIITDGEKIIWQRPIPLGGNHFTRALTKDMKLTFAKAEHLKRNAVKSPDLKKILASLKTVLNDFVGEVQRSLGYFTNTHRDATIQYMVGLGNAFRLPGLQKYLQEKLQLEVRKLSKLERVTGESVVAAPTFTENLLSFSVAYGLALQGLKLSRIQTNLLPYDIRVERIVRGKKPWAAAAAASLLLAVAGLTFGYSVERKGVDNPELKSEMTKAKSTQTAIGARKADYEAEQKKMDEAKKAIEKIGGGVDQRFNWQRLYRYINMALPKPNGDRLVKVSRGQHVVKDKYFTKEAQRAFDMLETKRFKTSEPLSPADEEFIKKYLVQVNIVGINALFIDNYDFYFKNIFYGSNKRLTGMAKPEADLVTAYVAGSETEASAAKAKMPSKGYWAVEIRGYTYNLYEGEFVERTLLENLANPEGLGGKLSKEMEEVKNEISYLLLFRNEAIPNPKVGTFEKISKSFLKLLLAEPGTDPTDPKRKKERDPTLTAEEATKQDRNAWKPIGEVASATIETLTINLRDKSTIRDTAAPPPKETAPTDVPRQPRTEFAVLFLWKEPLPESALQTPPPTTTTTTSPPTASPPPDKK
jgi:type IV pilus assembly protein PilM